MKSWDDVLRYIKSQFTNQEIEISDAEILEYLINNTLPEFSVYIPRFYRVIIDTNNCVDEFQGIFEIPIPENEKFEIIDIYDWYPSFGSRGAYNGGYPGGVIGAALGTWFSDATNTAPPVYPIFDKNSGNRVIFNTRLSELYSYLPATLVLKVTHTSPQTIPTEIYYRFFKPFCYADVLILLGNIRSKFQQLSTPVGQILTNAEQLKSEGLQRKREIIESLKRINVSNLIFYG